MDEFERKAKEDIENYGCHILNVMEEDDLPRFSYSIGIQKCTGMPELIVTGLKHELANWIINEYNNRVRAGDKFEVDKFYSDFLGNFDVTFKRVDRSHYKEHFGWGLWFYGDDTFDVLQLIYPSTSGVWPWDKDAPKDFTWFIPKLYVN